MPPKAAELSESAGAPNAEEFKTAPQQVRAGTDSSLVLNVDLPAGYHLNAAAPQRYSVTVDNPKVIAIDQNNARRTDKGLKLPIRIPFRAGESGSAKLRVQATLFYCREDNTGTCRIKTLVWDAPVEAINNPTAPTEIKLQGRLLVD
jgi:hypothetical protein